MSNPITTKVNGGAASDSTYVRPNLLDNWYFVGGGSQQDFGQFPVNQRRQTAYTGGGYYIDRWRGAGAYCQISILSDGLRVSGVDGNAYLNQFFDKGMAVLVGKTVCGSILLSDGTLYFGAGVFPNQALGNEGGTVYLTDIGDAGHLMVEYLPNYPPMFTVNVFPDRNIDVVAVKLELGDTQTLAHNEGTYANPVWVLNELPNYQAELVKCLRYLWEIHLYPTYSMVAVGGYTGDVNGTRLIFQPPVPMMRTNHISTSFTGDSINVIASNNDVQTISSIQWTTNSGSFLKVAPVMNSAFSAGGLSITRLESANEASIIISSEFQP